MRCARLALSSLVLTTFVACGGSDEDAGLFGAGGGSAGAAGAAKAGSGGKASGGGGSTAGGTTGGGSAGKAGGAAGSTSAGHGGTAGAGNSGAAGSTSAGNSGAAGAGGAAGKGGGGAAGKAGAGGSTAGKGGGAAAGSGGSTGGGGGTAAGSGGTNAGTGGTNAGSGGTAAGSGGVNAGGGGAAGAGGSPALCDDLTMNGTETDVDCGGDVCKPCPDGKGCQKFSDCLGAICNGGVCESPPACNDGKLNGAETDLDCGGPVCGATCINGQICKLGTDCASTVCTLGICKKKPLVFALGVPQDLQSGSLTAPWFADIGDVDNDGQADVLIADSDGNRVTMLKNTGGTLSVGGSTTVCANPFHVLARRMNADANADFVVACSGGNAQIYLGSGAGTFATPLTFTHATVWANIVDELGGAAGNDVVTLSNTTGQNEFIRFGNGTGTFAPPLPGNLAQAPSHGIAVDLTNDGTKDIVVTGNQTDANGTQVYISRSNGNTTFTAMPTLTVAAGPRSVASADFNGDGNQDIVVASSTGDTVTVFLGKGDGTFGGGTAFAGGDGARWVATPDLDDDGWPDLAVVSINDDRLRIFLNDGTGKFTALPAMTLGSAQEPRAIAAGDLNGDGLPDLVIPYSSSATFAGGVLVYLNTSK